MLRLLIIIHFITAAIRHRVVPWRFFQMNCEYFNEEKGLFSKLDIDKVIPSRWRLPQQLDDGISQPFPFPCFVKPEWGQNSHAVFRADSADMLHEIRKMNTAIDVPFMLQEAALGRREFEVFYIRATNSPGLPAILTITETLNHSGEALPINSVLNPHSEYRERTADFSTKERGQIWDILGNIGRFRMARVGLRADNLHDIADGSFQIIEINIFLPMPLSLLDTSKSWPEKYHFIKNSMNAAAQMVSTVPAKQHGSNIFFRKLRAHYRVKA